MWNLQQKEHEKGSGKMKNSDLAESFAQGATSGKGNHVFISGNVIYSYGYHFPIAIRTGSNTALFNTSGYSHTTAVHKGNVKRALQSAGFTLIGKSTDELQKFISEK